MLSAVHCDLDHLQRSVARLDTQIHSVLLENLELRSSTEEQQEASGLRLTLEELKTDLQEPDASAVRQTQKQVNVLKANIHVARQTPMERKAHLESEQQTQTQLRREIEIQECRCEAILERLRSQLKKAQSSHWQLRSDVTHLQTQLEETPGS